jgi:hypothetical protein
MFGDCPNCGERGEACLCTYAEIQEATEIRRRWPVIEAVKVMRLFAWYPDKLMLGERSQFLVRIEDGL